MPNQTNTRWKNAMVTGTIIEFIPIIEREKFAVAPSTPTPIPAIINFIKEWRLSIVFGLLVCSTKFITEITQSIIPPIILGLNGKRVFVVLPKAFVIKHITKTEITTDNNTFILFLGETEREKPQTKESMLTAIAVVNNKTMFMTTISFYTCGMLYFMSQTVKSLL